MRLDRFHDPQDGVAVNVLQREVDQMRIRVNANRVSMGHEQPTLAHQRPALLAKDGDVPRFGGYIQQFQTGIEGENVRVFPDRMYRQNLHGDQVNDGEFVFSSPATKANLSATSRAMPCGLSIPVISYRPTILAVAGSIATSSFFS